MADAPGDGESEVSREIAIESEADLAAVVALSGLPKISPSRLWSLLDLGSPSETWKRCVAARRHGTGVAPMLQTGGQGGHHESTRPTNSAGM